jgi:hypothetical protein
MIATQKQMRLGNYLCGDVWSGHPIPLLPNDFSAKIHRSELAEGDAENPSERES